MDDTTPPNEVFCSYPISCKSGSNETFILRALQDPDHGDWRALSLQIIRSATPDVPAAHLSVILTGDEARQFFSDVAQAKALIDG